MWEYRTSGSHNNYLLTLNNPLGPFGVENNTEITALYHKLDHARITYNLNTQHPALFGPGPYAAKVGGERGGGSVIYEMCAVVSLACICHVRLWRWRRTIQILFSTRSTK